MTIQFTKVAPVPTPKIQTEGSAGFDLQALEGGVIFPGEWQKIRTGIAVAIPQGHVGLIKPRSSLAVKHGLDVMAGVIDSDYRGELIVVLINHSKTMYSYCAEDRIAQLIVTPIMVAHKVAPYLNETNRGTGGFGSTGV